MAEEKSKLATALKQVREELNRAAKDKQAENKRRNRKQFFFARFVSFREIDGRSEPRQYVSRPAQQDQSSKLDEEMVRWTRAVASYTKWLVVVGALAAGIAYFTLKAIQGQLGEMQASGRQTDDLVKATKQSADAAKQSADSTIALERPTFFVLVKVEGAVPKEGPFDTVGTPSLPYTVLNLGRVPGIIRAAYTRCYLQRGVFPDHPVIDTSQMRMAQNAIAAGALGTGYPPCHFEQAFSKQDWLDISVGTAIPVFTAILIYEGPLDYTYVDTVSYRVELFVGGNVYPLGIQNYTNEQASAGRVSKGATINLPNVIWKAQTPIQQK